MIKSKYNVFSLLLAVFMFISIFTVNAQDKRGDRNSRNRSYHIVVPPIPPIPPIPTLPSLPSIPPIPPIPPVEFTMPTLPTLPSLPVLPSLPELPDMEDFQGLASYYHSGDHFRVANGKTGLIIELDGRIRFNEDFSKIESISNNGFLLVMDEDSRKEVYIENDKETGEIVFSYYIKGRLLPFQGEGEEWLQSVWKHLVEVYQ